MLPKIREIYLSDYSASIKATFNGLIWGLARCPYHRSWQALFRAGTWIGGVWKAIWLVWWASRALWISVGRHCPVGGFPLLSSQLRRCPSHRRRLGSRRAGLWAEKAAAAALSTAYRQESDSVWIPFCLCVQTVTFVVKLVLFFFAGKQLIRLEISWTRVNDRSFLAVTKTLGLPALQNKSSSRCLSSVKGKVTHKRVKVAQSIHS